jgi:hypothetical protein
VIAAYQRAESLPTKAGHSVAAVQHLLRSKSDGAALKFPTKEFCRLLSQKLNQQNPWLTGSWSGNN